LIVLAETVLKAGETARGSLRRRTSAEMLAKAPRDYQTEIDVAVERIIFDEMTKAFPARPCDCRRPPSPEWHSPGRPSS
ncbi:hypothetical protein AB9F45_39320, partial [Rhizobium leguminosarum]